MFDLGFIAANTSAEWDTKADVFHTETLTADEDGNLNLKYGPVPVVENGKKAYLFYRLSSDGDVEYKKMSVEIGNPVVPGFTAGEIYCVMYRYTNDNAETITISSQFIPETLHAILTVALYAGDSCNAEVTTKVGEITVDIPRFQLSGSTEISMTANGAAQTSLEGNALASGCSGCDGKATYARITKVIFDAKWYDNLDEIICEEADYESNPPTIELQVSSGTKTRQLHMQASMTRGTPRALSYADLDISFENSKFTVDESLVLHPVAGSGAGTTDTMTVILKESMEDDSPIAFAFKVEAIA